MICKSFATFLKNGSAFFLLFVLLFVLLFGGNWPLPSGMLSFLLREITAVLRGAEMQLMVFLCLGIYFVTFTFLRLRLEADLTQKHHGAEGDAPGVACPTVWLSGVLIFCVLLYTVQYAPSTAALTLLFGATIGQVVGWLQIGKQIRFYNASTRPLPENGNGFVLLLVALLVILLGLASVWNNEVGSAYAYRSQARWTGPWDNPNIYGLLMGTGIALAMGGAIISFKFQVFSRGRGAGWKGKVGKFVCAAWCLLAAVLMGRGLLNSYSRGAWLATGCGLAYLMGFWLWCFFGGENQGQNRTRKMRILNVSWPKKNWLALVVILVAAGAICFWHLRQIEWHPARRALSAVKSVDFSSRNRVAAWVGNLQIMAEHPWLGTGWNQPEPLYDHYYLPPRLTESAAIQMNDYLMLGATLGIPALFCFVMYLGLSLMQNEKLKIKNAAEENADGAQSRVAAEVTRLKLKPENRNEIADNTADADRQCSDCNSQKLPLDATQEPRLVSVESAPPTVGIPRFSQSLLTSTATKMGPVMRLPPSSNFLAATCRAGAIVLLVGFWFDGGLFKLPTAATFWILLELGSVQAQTNPNERTAKK